MKKIEVRYIPSTYVGRRVQYKLMYDLVTEFYDWIAK